MQIFLEILQTTTEELTLLALYYALPISRPMPIA